MSPVDIGSDTDDQSPPGGRFNTLNLNGNRLEPDAFNFSIDWLARVALLDCD